MLRISQIGMFLGLVALIGCEQKSEDRTPVQVTPGEVAPGQVTSEDVRRDFGQAVNTAVEFSQQAKDEFQKKLEDRLKNLDVEIAKLQEKGRDLKDEAKADWDRKMTELEVKRNAVRVKLTEVGNSSAEAWKDVQKGAQSAWTELDKAFQDAAGKF